MNRFDEIMAAVPEASKDLVKEVVDEIVFLEGRLEELKKLPFIQVHPKDAAKQRNTPAAKMYKEFLQQYINCIKVVESIIYKDKRLESDDVDESPLRKWFRNNVDTRKKDLDTGQ